LGETLGSPISLVIWNRDWENWQTVMSPAPVPDSEADVLAKAVHLPRPGHADLVGALKYDRQDARDILERASARETTARVAAGAVAKRILRECGITIASHIVSLGGIDVDVPDEL